MSLRPEAVAQEARFHKTLGDPPRLRIFLALLKKGEANVGDLATAAKLSHSRASQLLIRALDCGFTTSRREGTYTLYKVHPDWLEAVKQISARVDNNSTTSTAKKGGNLRERHQDRDGEHSTTDA